MGEPKIKPPNPKNFLKKKIFFDKDLHLSKPIKKSCYHECASLPKKERIINSVEKKTDINSEKKNYILNNINLTKLLVPLKSKFFVIDSKDGCKFNTRNSGTDLVYVYKKVNLIFIIYNRILEKFLII